MFARVFFDIYGGCNAKCPWCQTGWATRQGKPVSSQAIAPNAFARSIDYMLSKEIIGPQTVLDLYNFAEPFLHPQFEDIIRLVARTGLRFGLSTNASRVRTFSEPVLNNLMYLTISMPGFSQASYDRVHGFRFETIKSNILTIVKNFQECGFRGNPYIAYHVYQFNIEEIDDACKFAVDNDLGLAASYAVFNDLDMGLSYLESTMPYEQLRRAGQELVLHYVDDLLALQPADYMCAQQSVLALNESCQVLLCCGVDKNAGVGVLGNLFEMDAATIRQRKEEHPLCKRCLPSGSPYWGHHQVYLRKVNRASAMRSGPVSFGDGVSVVEQPPSCAGAFESASQVDVGIMLLKGWAQDGNDGTNIDQIIVTDDKKKVLAAAPIQTTEDGGQDSRGRRRWQARIDVRHVSPGTQHLQGYALDKTARVAYRLANGVDLE